MYLGLVLAIVGLIGFLVSFNSIERFKSNYESDPLGLSAYFEVLGFPDLPWVRMLPGGLQFVFFLSLLSFVVGVIILLINMYQWIMR